MKKEITKRIPSKKAVTLTFDIYEGFKDIEQLESKMCELKVYEKQYLALYFLGKYYGVVNHSPEISLVVGKNISWLRDSNIWSKENTLEMELPFTPGALLKGQLANTEIIKDLINLDPNFQILNGYKTGWRDIRDSYQYSAYFAELLGRTFYSTFFNKENLYILSTYGLIEESILLEKFKNPRIKEINPFRTEALFITGKVHRITLN